ncbi:MAG: hypothetical protein U9O89_01305 [Thermoproteota archaeon]|nr:hypothetical protein [Thermoproteota archaeon]
MLKIEGLKFVQTWFSSPKCIPPNLTRLYQLLLQMVTMKGMLPVYLTRRLGYTSKLIDKAVTQGYVELSLAPKKPSEKVLKRIREIIGKPPREMFV